MRTLEEKVNYNKKRYKTDNFSAGYVIGVQMYHDYPKYDEKGKAEARKTKRRFQRPCERQKWRQAGERHNVRHTRQRERAETREITFPLSALLRVAVMLPAGVIKKYRGADKCRTFIR